jgi:hypothetical protein
MARTKHYPKLKDSLEENSGMKQIYSDCISENIQPGNKELARETC